MGRSKTPRTVTGLDIEPGFVAAAEVRADGLLAVERCATATLAPQLMAEGEVASVEGLAEALRELFEGTELGRRVRVGVANARVAVRTLDLPPITDRKDLDAAVRFQAADQLPIPIEQAALDYQSLGVVDTPDGPRTRVVVVAAQRDMIARLLAALREAGLRPEGIDLSAFALIRALSGGRAALPGATLYANVGGLTNLAIAHGTTCLFTRVAASGIEAIAADLAPRHGLTLEHARQWLGHVGLAAPLDEVDGEQAIVASAREALEDGLRRIADDVRTSLEFYGLQGALEPVERIVLAGPAAQIDGFSQAFAEQVTLPVELGAVAGASTPALAIAAGLAVEEATVEEEALAA